MPGKARDYGIPGTPIFDGARAQQGYALNKMCYFVQFRREPRGVPARRGGVLRAVRTQSGAARRDP